MKPATPHRAALIDPVVTVNDRGDEELSYDPGVRREDVRCFIAKVGAVELRGERLASVTDWESLWPAGLAIDERTWVEWRDRTFEVDGEPTRVENLDGVEEYVHAKLRRVAG